MEDELFGFIEAPEFYSDGFHPNAKGRQKLTVGLVKELTAHLSLSKNPTEDSGGSR